jgi:type II secretory pathway pseudopilin PulG
MARGDPKRIRSFTIVELMVAMALMIILTAVIVIIFAKSRDVSLYSEAQAQVFQNARYAMDVMASDLASIIKTIDMEPFIDKIDPNTREKNGHYDIGEDYAKVLGGPYEERYDFSLTIHQGEYEMRHRGETLTHWADTIFMKTITTDKGRPVEGFVSYGLSETDQPRPVLRRRVEYYDRQARMMIPNPAREDDICFFVTDFRVEFYYVNYRDSAGKPRKPGIWLTPKAAHDMGILDPEPKAETYVFNYHYDGRLKGRIDMQASGRGKLLVNAADGNRVSFKTDRDFTFPQLVPGDRIYIYGAIPKKPPGQMPWIFDSELTIGEISANSKQIYFQERVILEPMSNAPLPSAMTCNYRAGFLPAALRITIRVKDERADAIRTIQRVFWVRSG